MITACPARLQWSPVSTATSPVALTAEVAVKNASTGEVKPPSALANGKMRRTPPITAKKMKP